MIPFEREIRQYEKVRAKLRKLNQEDKWQAL